MLFIDRKERFLQTARIAAATLALLSATRSLAEGSSPDAAVIFDAGQPRRFEIARDELAHVPIVERVGSCGARQFPGGAARFV